MTGGLLHRSVNRPLDIWSFGDKRAPYPLSLHLNWRWDSGVEILNSRCVSIWWQCFHLQSTPHRIHWLLEFRRRCNAKVLFPEDRSCWPFFKSPRGQQNAFEEELHRQIQWNELFEVHFVMYLKYSSKITTFHCICNHIGIGFQPHKKVCISITFSNIDIAIKCYLTMVFLYRCYKIHEIFLNLRFIL